MKPDLSYLCNLEFEDRSKTIGEIFHLTFDEGVRKYHASLGKNFSARTPEDETRADEIGRQHLDKKISDILALSLDFDPGYAYNRMLWHTKPASTLNSNWKLLAEKGLHIQPNSQALARIWERLLEDGRETEIKYLVSKGLMPNWRGSDYSGYAFVEKTDNFLWLIQRQKHVVALRAVPDHAIEQVMHETNSKGETALHRAARFVLPEYIKRLIALGADPQAKTKKDQTPIDMIKRTKSRNAALDETIELLGQETNKNPNDLFVQACESLSVSMATLALNKGADLEKMIKEENILKFVFNTFSDNSLTAIRKLQVKFVEWMLTKDVDWTDQEGNTILHHAVRNGATPVVGLILEQCPEMLLKLNHENRLAVRMRTELYEKVFEDVKVYDPSRDGRFCAMTQKRMFQLYKKHGMMIEEGAFPNMQDDQELKSSIELYILKQNTKNNPSAKTRSTPRL